MLTDCDGLCYHDRKMGWPYPILYRVNMWLYISSLNASTFSLLLSYGVRYLPVPSVCHRFEITSA